MSGTQDTHDEDTRRTQPGDTGEDYPFSERKQSSITGELQELGRQLVTTARAAWQSEQRRELQQDITMGLRSVADQLNEAVESVRLNPRSDSVKESMKERVSKVTGAGRAGDLVDDARGTLASGLRELNEQLRRLTERLEREGSASAPGTATTEAPETTPPTGTNASTAGGATLPASDVQVAPPTSTTARANVPDSTPESPRIGALPGAPEGGAERPSGDGTPRPEGQ